MGSPQLNPLSEPLQVRYVASYPRYEAVRHHRPNRHPLRSHAQDIYQLKVSSHLLIDRKGQITQFVPFDRRAWHAGVSKFAGREGCNDFSIGIELEGSEGDIFENIQYEKLSQVTNILLQEYTGISKKDIKAHSDIAPGRKTDPGILFDWDRYLSNV